MLEEMLRQLKLSSGGRDLADRLESRLESLRRERVLQRIWSQDHTVWHADPTEITDPNRLGWLKVAERMTEEQETLEAFAARVQSEAVQSIVLLGMGGSALAPEVMFESLAKRPGYPRLHLLDTTVPAEIAALERELDLDRTLFIVASKSGTTLETVSQLAYFWDKVPDGQRFIAITDPGTLLAEEAEKRSFRRLFLNPPDIGGRYSALSYFGLVPAALCGVELAPVLSGALEAMQACRPDGIEEQDNAAVALGALLGEAALAGRDKVTLCLPEGFESLGDWLEQLLAESTGKEGKGIVPITGEALGPPVVYGEDRLFLALGDVEGTGELQRAYPFVCLPFERSAGALGAQFFQWQLATAVAGHVLSINPFDQPDVQSAKDAAARFLAEEQPPEALTPSIESVLRGLGPRDYIAVQAYLPREQDVRDRLQAARMRLRNRYRVATSVGFGPRYLHSTGQVHKGGPPTGVFVQIVDGDEPDLPVPGRPFSFGMLERAQARGDLEALRTMGRRAVRCTLEQLEEAAT
jgi:glucose-6-phosphate isomerase